MNSGSGERRVSADFLKRILFFTLTLLLGGFLGAVLLRVTPGSGVDDRDLDAQYSAESRAGMHREQAAKRNVLKFYFLYLERVLHGDLGISRTLALPVSELIVTRGAVTVPLIGAGLAIGWVLGLSLAALSVAWQNAATIVFSEVLSGLALSLPAAVLALLIFLANGPISPVIGVVIFPRVFRLARDLFAKSLSQPQVLAARARGIPERWILLRYVARPALAPLLALGGVSVSLAFGAVIAVEVVCDLPGLGQLALQAAMGYDMPLLVGLTLVITAVTLAANALADLLLEASRA